MNVRTKHRIIGGLVLLALAAIFLPLAFHGSREISSVTVSARIPKLPPQPQVSLELETPKKTLATKPVAPVASVTVPPKIITAVAEKANVDAKPGTVANIKQMQTAKNQLSISAQAVKPASLPRREANQVNQKPRPVQVATASTKALQVTITPPDAWTLQLASFSNKVNANHLVDQLRQSGIDSYTRTLQINGAKITRVFVGPEIQKARLVKTEHRLEKQFGLHGVIRKYEV